MEPDNFGRLRTVYNGFFPIGGGVGPSSPQTSTLTNANGGIPFYGVFNGNGYTISGLTIYRPTQIAVGLFGYVIGNSGISGRIASPSGIYTIAGQTSATGMLENVGLINPSINANVPSGTTLSSYHIRLDFGALAGVAQGASILNAYASGVSVTGGSYTGGLVGNIGFNSGGTAIAYCYSTGTVNGSAYVGGLAGGKPFEYRTPA